MRTQRDDAITVLNIAKDTSHLVAETGDLHGTPRNPRFRSLNQPYAGPLAPIEDRAMGTCNVRVERSWDSWIEIVAPSGALDESPSST